MNSSPSSRSSLSAPARQFLETTAWRIASCEALTGDASTRQYFRLRDGTRTAVLMDASRNPECVAPFLRIDRHLEQLGFSVPTLFAWEAGHGFILLEDFGDATFTRLLEQESRQTELYALATDILIALHKNGQAIPEGLRAYRADKMLEDIELFLEWRTPGISEQAREEFRSAWSRALPVAHQVPASLLLRDFHVANLMLLPDRAGLRRGGLLDFQDAYQGPITYDLISLLEDARRDVPGDLREEMIGRYLGQFPGLEAGWFRTSMAILAAQRHTRVLGIFERLSQREGKHDYKKLHSPRIERMLRQALNHPGLAEVRRWFDRYAR
jgi:N-acetylmuramate 1-kinase